MPYYTNRMNVCIGDYENQTWLQPPSDVKPSIVVDLHCRDYEGSPFCCATVTTGVSAVQCWGTAEGVILLPPDPSIVSVAPCRVFVHFLSIWLFHGDLWSAIL
jgi:hypothetical protein